VPPPPHPTPPTHNPPHRQTAHPARAEGRCGLQPAHGVAVTIEVVRNSLAPSPGDTPPAPRPSELGRACVDEERELMSVLMKSVELLLEVLEREVRRRHGLAAPCAASSSAAAVPPPRCAVVRRVDATCGSADSAARGGASACRRGRKGGGGTASEASLRVLGRHSRRLPGRGQIVVG
jgi:hypothetical protein